MADSGDTSNIERCAQEIIHALDCSATTLQAIKRQFIPANDWVEAELDELCEFLENGSENIRYSFQPFKRHPPGVFVEYDEPKLCELREIAANVRYQILYKAKQAFDHAVYPDCNVMKEIALGEEEKAMMCLQSLFLLLKKIRRQEVRLAGAKKGYDSRRAQVLAEDYADLIAPLQHEFYESGSPNTVSSDFDEVSADQRIEQMSGPGDVTDQNALHLYKDNSSVAKPIETYLGSEIDKLNLNADGFAIPAGDLILIPPPLSPPSNRDLVGNVHMRRHSQNPASQNLAFQNPPSQNSTFQNPALLNASQQSTIARFQPLSNIGQARGVHAKVRGKGYGDDASYRSGLDCSQQQAELSSPSYYPRHDSTSDESYKSQSRNFGSFALADNIRYSDELLAQSPDTPLTAGSLRTPWGSYISNASVPPKSAPRTASSENISGSSGSNTVLPGKYGPPLTAPPMGKLPEPPKKKEATLSIFPRSTMSSERASVRASLAGSPTGLEHKGSVSSQISRSTSDSANSVPDIPRRSVLRGYLPVLHDNTYVPNPIVINEDLPSSVDATALYERPTLDIQNRSYASSRGNIYQENRQSPDQVTQQTLDDSWGSPKRPHLEPISIPSEARDAGGPTPFKTVPPARKGGYLPSEANNYAGFCKAAYRRQVGQEKKTWNIATHPAGFLTSMETVTACQKCRFEGPAVKNGKKVEPPTRPIGPKGGLQYRWSFLFKCHVDHSSAMVGAENQRFGCIFCCGMGKGTPVFVGKGDFLRHIECVHRRTLPQSEHFNGRVVAVIGRSPRQEEDFDIALPPFNF